MQSSILAATSIHCQNVKCWFWLQVGPGVKRMREDDWVIPLKGGLGTWQSLLVVKASDVIVLPKECMPFEYASLSHQLCLALRLLEDFGNLKVTRPNLSFDGSQSRMCNYVSPGDDVLLDH